MEDQVTPHGWPRVIHSRFFKFHLEVGTGWHGLYSLRKDLTPEPLGYLVIKYPEDFRSISHGNHIFRCLDRASAYRALMDLMNG